MQPPKLGDIDFIQTLNSLQADLFVIVAFRMLPESVWNMPRLGSYNVHSSLLPKYRGAAPINRAIMNGETETGVSTFQLKHEIDTGRILMQSKTNIGPDETAGDLHDRLMHMGADLISKTLNSLEDGTAIMIDQDLLNPDKESLPNAPKIFSSDCQINWSRGSNEIHNQVRGLCPYPGSFTKALKKDGTVAVLKIHRTRPNQVETNGDPGTMVNTGNHLHVTCGEGSIEIIEIQLEGKKKMLSADFLRGNDISGWRLI
jgi:methionyl-tRNA formyltransferase